MLLKSLNRPPVELMDCPSESVVDAVCLPHFWLYGLPMMTVSPDGWMAMSLNSVLPM